MIGPMNSGDFDGRIDVRTVAPRPRANVRRMIHVPHYRIPTFTGAVRQSAIPAIVSNFLDGSRAENSTAHGPHKILAQSFGVYSREVCDFARAGLWL